MIKQPFVNGEKAGPRIARVSFDDSTSYRPDIDGLRGLGIIFAIGFHAGIPGTGGGFTAIDMFFVISGFVITRMIVGQQEAGKFNIKKFYIRRILRLVPVTVPVLAMASIGSALLMNASEMETFFKSLVAMVFFCANFFFYYLTDYFNPFAEAQPLLHAWSLSVEEQFYFLWPVAMLFGALWLRRIWILALIWVGLITSLAFMLWLHPERANAGYYMLPARLWEVLAGALLGYAKPFSLNNTVRSVLGTFGLVGLVASFVFVSPTGGFPNIWAVLPVLSSCALLIAADFPQGEDALPSAANRILSLPALVWVGLISYSLYLWHWPILTLARLAEVTQLSVGFRVALMLSVVPIAWLSYRWVELPWREKARHAKADQIAAAVALGAAAFSVVTATVALKANALQQTEPAVALALGEKDRIVAGNGKCHGWEVDKPLPECRHSPTNAASGEWLLIGDSHADAMAQELAAALNARGIALTHLSQSSCPTGSNFEVYISITNLQTDYCAGANARIIDAALTSGNIDTLVVASLWPMYTSSELWSEAPALLLDKGKRVDHEERLLSFLEAARQKRGRSLRIVLMGPLPFPNHDVPVCVDRRMRLGRSTTQCLEQPADMTRRLLAPTLDMIKRVAGKTGATVVDSVTPFCDAWLCRFGRPDQIWWYDDRHLAKQGAAVLANSMLAQLELDDI